MTHRVLPVSVVEADAVASRLASRTSKGTSTVVSDSRVLMRASRAFKRPEMARSSAARSDLVPQFDSSALRLAMSDAWRCSCARISAKERNGDGFRGKNE
jgi:hypothetical protein